MSHALNHKWELVLMYTNKNGCYWFVQAKSGAKYRGNPRIIQRFIGHQDKHFVAFTETLPNSAIYGFVRLKFL